MADSASTVSGVAQRYASALFELARETSALDPVAADLGRFAALLDESPDLVRLVRSPIFSSDEQLRAVEAVLVAAGIGGVAGNFIKVAAKNRRLFAVPEMIVAYREFLARHRGEIAASVTSAEPLSDTQVAALQAAVKDATGKDVVLARKVDPTLIGGLIVQIGSRMIDTSLRTKLNALRFAMKEAG